MCGCVGVCGNEASVEQAHSQEGDKEEPEVHVDPEEDKLLLDQAPFKLSVRWPALQFLCEQ